MSRTIYLIRHGHPDFPLGAHMCLGRTDTPLGALGRMQACLLGKELGDKDLSVFTSPLTRCRQTAAPLGGEAVPVPDLAEQNMGQLAAYLRMKVDNFVPYQFNQVKGQPFVVEELVNAFTEILNKK